MFKAVLFDLDGTLLPMDTEYFIAKYLGLLSKHIAPFMDSEIFIPKLMGATDQMINNLDENKTNEEVFIEEFFAETKLNPKEMMPYFEQFYENHFPKLADYFPPDPIMPTVVEKVLEKYLGVVATNPIFPKAAIIERLRWAGVSEQPFTLITSYENMHYCKPQLEYYLEIAEKLQVEPKDCLMIGNDVDEDLIAKEVGMKTFLIEDYIINTNQIDYKADYQGTGQDLLNFLNNCMDL